MFKFRDGIDIAGSGPTTGQIVFPGTQNASTGANTLDDYWEGSWTPTDASGAGLGLTLAVGRFIKIGRIVVVHGTAQYPATASGLAAKIGSLPFTVDPTTNQDGVLSTAFCNRGNDVLILARRNTTYVELFNELGNATLTNANMTGALIQFGGAYLASA